jgi:hypothetical protein
MNETQCCQKTVSFVGVLGAFLVVGVLVYAMKQYTRPAPLNTARIEERKKALAEIRAEDTRGLSTYEVTDAGKGIVRLKIERAMELTIDAYKNPVAARADLTARADKAGAPAPKAPEKPNQFE